MPKPLPLKPSEITSMMEVILISNGKKIQIAKGTFDPRKHESVVERKRMSEKVAEPSPEEELEADEQPKGEGAQEVTYTYDWLMRNATVRNLRQLPEWANVEGKRDLNTKDAMVQAILAEHS